MQISLKYSKILRNRPINALKRCTSRTVKRLRITFGGKRGKRQTLIRFQTSIAEKSGLLGETAVFVGYNDRKSN